MLSGRMTFSQLGCFHQDWDDQLSLDVSWESLLTPIVDPILNPSPLGLNLRQGGAKPHTNQLVYTSWVNTRSGFPVNG